METRVLYSRDITTLSENNSLKQSMETRVLFERYNNTVSDLGGGGGVLGANFAG